MFLMKSINKITIILSTLFLFTITACGGGDKKENVDQTGPEYTSAYICPMHCEGSGSTEPGKCPVCDMDYKANPDHIKGSEKAEKAAYACPMHAEITGNDGDSCSVCHMALKPIGEEGHDGHDHDNHEGHDHGGHDH